MVKQTAQLFGLVLAGGKSRRMKKDKSRLKFNGEEQSVFVYRLLEQFCSRVFLSCRKNQKLSAGQKKLSLICDLKKFEGAGPLTGMLSAMSRYPKSGWLVMACDLPFVDDKTIRRLLDGRDPKKIATAFRGHENLPEPLCAIYEPAAKKVLSGFFKSDIHCPRKILIRSRTKLLKLKSKNKLDNINTPADFSRALRTIKK